LVLSVLAGCRSGSPPAPDAAITVRPTDAAPRSDDAVSTPLAVDFTVSACPRFESGPRCTGRAPLTVEFVPLTTASVTRFLWDFGDGTAKSSARAPQHTYAFPGIYNVTLVGVGTAGSAPRTRLGFVVVLANQAGEPCDVDQQCESRLHCVCSSMVKCSPAFTRGLCAAECTGTDCQAGELCADLTLAKPAGEPEPWQKTPLCLAACQSDGDCSPGLHCRDLPAARPTGAWLRACFPAVPGSAGSSCRSASGQLRNDACVTGQCIDLGANGLCSLDCSSAGCPPSTACADLTDGRHVCLQRCGGEVACDRDPLLACTPPNMGPLGFTVVGGEAGATYCAPKTCAKHEDCGPAGTCRDDLNGAHCVRRQ
jgi:PKD repeat protein